MSVINISIKRGLKQIYGWMIHPFNVMDNERTIEQFYNDLPLDVLSEENQELEEHSGHALYHLADHLIGNYHMDFEG